MQENKAKTALIDRLMLSKRNEENAFHMEKYMKGHFVFYGVKQPVRMEIFKEFNACFSISGYDELMDLVFSLWDREQREYQFLAMDLIFKYKKLWNEAFIADIEKLIRSKSWWDTVDMLTGKYASLYFLKHPGEMRSTYLRWSRDSNMWVNRGAIIGQLRMKQATDKELLEQCIVPHLASNEFFLRKGIGWALREFSKYDAAWVLDFCRRHALKPLSLKEALRLIPKQPRI